MTIHQLLSKSWCFRCLIGTKFTHQAATNRLMLTNCCVIYLMESSPEGLEYWKSIRAMFEDRT